MVKSRANETTASSGKGRAGGVLGSLHSHSPRRPSDGFYGRHTVMAGIAED